MDTSFRKTRTRAGAHALRTHRKNLLNRWTLAAVASFLFCIVLLILLIAGVVSVWVGLLSVPFMYLVFKIWDKETEDSDNTWGAGARAERQVGEELDRLHQIGFHVFHDVHSGVEGEGNVDHLLIGREGVFVVETKSWQGVITSDQNRDGEAILKRNGRWMRYCNPLSQARGSAAKASEMIGDAAGRKPYVNPVVCFSRADVRLFGKVGGVEVCELGALKRVILQGRSKIFTDEQVGAMAEAISRRIGFEPSAAPGIPPESPTRTKRFARWVFDQPSIYLTICFLFLLSFILPRQFSESLEAFSVLYGVLADVYGYYLF